MSPVTTILSTAGNAISRATFDGSSRWATARFTLDARPHCLAADRFSASTVYAGSSHGVLRSDDAGRTWRACGLMGHDVRAIVPSPAQADVLYAGTRPVGFFISRDGGDTWNESTALRRLARRRAFFSPAEWPPIPYVSAIAPSGVDVGRIVVGFEVGGVVVTNDGGESWQVGRGAIYDCHTLAAHPRDGLRYYQGGAGLGKACRISTDGGVTWSGPRAVNGLTYGWAVIGNPDDPDTCYYSASSSPFKAHSVGRAAATIYRVRSGRPAEPLRGGLPDAIPDMPYQLLARHGSLYAGLANGDVWRSDDHGMSWQRLSLNLGGIERSMTLL